MGGGVSKTSYESRKTGASESHSEEKTYTLSQIRHFRVFHNEKASNCVVVLENDRDMLKYLTDYSNTDWREIKLAPLQSKIMETASEASVSGTAGIFDIISSFHDPQSDYKTCDSEVVSSETGDAAGKGSHSERTEVSDSGAKQFGGGIVTEAAERTHPQDFGATLASYHGRPVESWMGGSDTYGVTNSVVYPPPLEVVDGDEMTEAERDKEYDKEAFTEVPKANEQLNNNMRKIDDLIRPMYIEVSHRNHFSLSAAISKMISSFEKRNYLNNRVASLSLKLLGAHSASGGLLAKIYAEINALISVLVNDKKRYDGDSKTIDVIDDGFNPSPGITPDYLELCRTLLLQCEAKIQNVQNFNESLTKPKDLTIFERIHVGQFSCSFLALRQGRSYTYVKVFDKNHVLKEDVLQNVNKEKVIISKCSVFHDYFPLFLGAFQRRNSLFIISEFIPGGNLHTFLRSMHKLPSKVALRLSFEICSGVAILHKHQVIHSNLKPSSILITHHGTCKISGFGWAKSFRNSGRKLTEVADPGSRPPSWLESFGNSSSSFNGSERSSKSSMPTSARSQSVASQDGEGGDAHVDVNYLTPEVLIGGQTDHAVDWWSCGVILYQMVMGVPPFYATSDERICSKILSGDFSPMQGVAGTLIPDFIPKLLRTDARIRLGSKSSEEVLQHPVFGPTYISTKIGPQDPPTIKMSLFKSKALAYFSDSSLSPSRPSFTPMHVHDVAMELETAGEEDEAKPSLPVMETFDYFPTLSTIR
jgi:serine/threonine protein kinase